MRKTLLFAGLVVFIACNSKKKEEPVQKKETIDTALTTQHDTTKTAEIVDSVTNPEKLGNLKLGMRSTQVVEVLGAPDSKTPAVEWGADGLMHQDWTYKKHGLVLNISGEKGKEEVQTLGIINAEKPCALKTNAGIGIGSSYQQVMDAYKQNIDKEQTDKTQIFVGSIYGGLVFSFKNDKVEHILVGAAAE